MSEIITLSTTRTDDEARLEMLGQFLAVVDNGEIVAEREVANGSGRIVGTEYDVTAETVAALDEAIAQADALAAE